MLDDLKQQIKMAVEGAVLGSRIVVAVAEDDGAMRRVQKALTAIIRIIS
jgi:tryptophan synthase alpha subunit